MKTYSKILKAIYYDKYGDGTDPWAIPRSPSGNGETIPQNKRCLTILSVNRGVNTSHNMCLRGA